MSISITFKENDLNGRKSLAELVLDQSWTVTIEKQFGL